MFGVAARSLAQKREGVIGRRVRAQSGKREFRDRTSHAATNSLTDVREGRQRKAQSVRVVPDLTARCNRCEIGGHYTRAISDR